MIYMAFCLATPFFTDRQKLRTFTTRTTDWNKHLQTLKSYFTFSLKHEQKIYPGLKSKHYESNRSNQVKTTKWPSVRYKNKKQLIASVEAAWATGLGRWIWNLKVPCSNPPPYSHLDLVSVFPSSTPRVRCVTSHLVSRQPLGILNSLCYIWNICLSIYSVPDKHT